MVNWSVNFDYSANHFNYTKYCTCGKPHRTFQIHNSVYDYNGRCKLTVERRKFFSFVCKVCGSPFEINDFERILMERGESVIRQRVNAEAEYFFKETERMRNQFEFETNKLALELFWSGNKN